MYQAEIRDGDPLCDKTKAAFLENEKNAFGNLIECSSRMVKDKELRVVAFESAYSKR